MTDLPSLLDRAAGADPEPATLTSSIGADLARGRRALARTRRRRTACGLAAVAAMGGLGIGTSRLTSGDHHRSPVAHQTSTHDSTRHTVAAVALLAQPFTAGPYTFGTTPDGWVVQGVSPSAVTIIPPAGHVDPSPDAFLGKLVILFDHEGPQGDAVSYDGRTFYVNQQQIDNGVGYTTISTHTRPGEQDGMVRVQFPDDTGWSRDTMLEFLSTVQVGNGAQPGVG